MVEKNIVNRFVAGGIFLAILVFVAILLQSIFIGLFGGAILAYITFPVYKIIQKRIPGRTWSTIVFLFCLLILIGIPLFLFFPSLLKEFLTFYLYIQKLDIPSTLAKILPIFLSSEMSNAISVQLNLAISQFFSAVLNSFSSMFSNLPTILIQVAIMLFTFFFAVKDADKIKIYLSEISPFSESTGNRFSEEFRHITDAIVYGQVLVGVIQGITLGLGLFLLGVNNVLILTLVAVISSIIPFFGAWLVWLPVSLYLFISGHTLQGTILFVYGLLFVSLIDNLLRPYFISRKSKLNFFVVIIGTIGGLFSFGIIGLVLGPLMLSYLLIILDFYRQGKLNELFK